MDSIQLFLKEITEELLYNIVYDEKEIDFRTLSENFEMKTGYRPMDFFGFGNRTGRGWLDFITGIPGVQGKKKIYIENNDDVYDSSDSEDEDHVYKVFNTTNLSKASKSSVSVADYREMILIKCCEIMADNFAELSSCKDTNSNTPLHLIAALPGINYDCDSLETYLLQAGVDPLAVNDDGQTFLHIIFGRYQAENDGNDVLHFKKDRVPKTTWFLEERVELLNLLSQELPPTHTALLAKAQDKNGNTVLHEYALSTAIEEKTAEKDKICKKIQQFGASLRITNNSGEAPLHYAYTPELFKIFLQEGAVCRARNDRDESPVLYITKMSIAKAFTGTSATAELADQGFVKITNNSPVSNVYSLLESLKKILSQNKDTKETVWIPDMKGNIAIDLVLIAIRIGSYDLSGTGSFLFNAMRNMVCSSLVQLLNAMLGDATATEMKWTTKKGQSFLHVLLDIGDNSKHTIIREIFIQQSVEILLAHNADVNAVDSEGRTPLDIANKHRDKRPSLYEKCAELLIKHGATGKRNTAIPSLPSTTIQTSSLTRMMSNLRFQSETRKLRSCPERHLTNANRLTDPKTEVLVVEKYRYSNQGMIGSGAFSSIFIAIKDENVDRKSGAIECRAYALKRMEKAKTNPKEIKREISTLLSLSDKCENIIKCHEPIEDQSFQYICLELMDGDLHEFVTNSDVNRVLKSNPATSVKITKEIINGLVFLHKENFIHRDLKPGNILYTTDPVLHFKIADFGLTKNTSSPSMTSSTGGSGVAMAAGSRCWMAPELVSMQSREHTTQSDVFSLGLVLHYLLTLGKHPFDTENEPAHVIERNIVANPPNLDRALRAEVTSFLNILLPKHPSKRPPAKYLSQHPYLWSDRKKIEFLKAVGDQPEAMNPVNSELERRLQKTPTGRNVDIHAWHHKIGTLYVEMITSWKLKKYRTDKLIDLIRFIRNAYAHKQERSPQGQKDLVENIFIQVYPSLVLDVFGVVQDLEFYESRSSIQEALILDT